MATTFSKNRQPSCSTDAHFRGWIEFIDTALTSGGWVNTADTGQTAVASFVAPTLANQARGYRIYRMDDTLQATVPVFMRLDFGSGNAAATPAVWVSLGASTDGAGTIVSPMVLAPTTSNANVQASSSSAAIALPYSFGSADTGRIAVALGVDFTAQGPYLAFMIERTYGPDGQPNADGVLFMWGTSTSTLNRYQYLQYPAAPQPVSDTSMFRVEHDNAVSNVSAASDRVGVSVLFPWFRGLPQQPGMSALLAKRGDWPTNARMLVEFYGAQHTYQALGPCTIANGGNTIALMRFE